MLWEPAAAFFIRGLATAFVVIGVTLLVGRVGPRIGGVVVGLPIVIGPGLYFLLAQEGVPFVRAASVATLFALTASVAFAWSFARLAPYRGPWVTLGGSGVTWLACLMLLQPLPAQLLVGLASFAAMLVLALALGSGRIAERAEPLAARRPFDLLMRGLAAGLVVGVAGLVAPAVGPAISAFILAYPIALSVVGVTLHQRHGGATAARTLATAQVSMSSIAAFSVSLYLLLDFMPPQSAFWLSVAASLLPMAVLSLLHGWRQQRAGGTAHGR